MAAAPTQNGVRLDQFNDALRQSPGWQQFMRRQGYRLQGEPIRLSDTQRRALQAELTRAGVQFPKGMDIDPAGNINQANQGVFQNKWVQVGLVSAAALATMGAAGYGPLAGLLSSGGGAAGGGAAAGGSLASSSIPGLHAAVPGAIASQSASAGLGAGGALASSAIPASMAMNAVPGVVASQGASAAIPGMAAGGAAAAARGAANGASNGGGFAKGLVDNILSPEGILSLAGLIPALTGMGQNSLQDDPNVKRQMDIANQSQQMQLDRYKRTDPLHESSVRLAYSMLPVSARNK